MDALTFWTMLAGIGAIGTAVATVWLVFVAKMGLSQIGIAKQDITLRSKREALHEAIRQCEVFRDSVILANGQVVDGFVKANLSFLVLDVRFRDIPPATHAQALKWADALPPELYELCIGALNQLEGFALYFTTRLADNEAAFKPTSDVFCRMVIQLYPVILYVRSTQGTGLYSNTEQLYTDWAGMKSRAQLEAQEQRLQQRLEEAKAQGVSLKHPPALGTDL